MCRKCSLLTNLFPQERGFFAWFVLLSFLVDIAFQRLWKLVTAERKKISDCNAAATHHAWLKWLPGSLSNRIHKSKLYVRPLSSNLFRQKWPFWFIHQLEQMQSWLSLRHPMQGAAVPGWLQPPAPAWALEAEQPSAKVLTSLLEKQWTPRHKSQAVLEEHCQHWSSHHLVNWPWKGQHPPKLSDLGTSQIFHTYLGTSQIFHT